MGNFIIIDKQRVGQKSGSMVKSENNISKRARGLGPLPQPIPVSLYNLVNNFLQLCYCCTSWISWSGIKIRALQSTMASVSACISYRCLALSSPINTGASTTPSSVFLLCMCWVTCWKLWQLFPTYHQILHTSESFLPGIAVKLSHSIIYT